MPLPESTAWKLVKEIEESSEKTTRELAEGKATMIVNFGPSGRTVPGLVDESMTMTRMIVAVFDHYHRAQPPA